MKHVDVNDLKSKVQELTGDEKVLIHIDGDLCKDLRYLYFKRDGLQNSILSYINATSEMANMMNFEKFVERIAQSSLEEQDLIDLISKKYLDADLYTYLTLPGSPHVYTIDFNNELIVIEPRNSTKIPGFACSCGTCGI